MWNQIGVSGDGLNHSIGKFFLVCFLGYLIGTVSGILLDRSLGMSFFSLFLLKESLRFEFYTILFEIQITPASLMGLVVSGYLAIKKG